LLPLLVPAEVHQLLFLDSSPALPHTDTAASCEHDTPEHSADSAQRVLLSLCSAACDHVFYPCVVRQQHSKQWHKHTSAERTALQKSQKFSKKYNLTVTEKISKAQDDTRKKQT